MVTGEGNALGLDARPSDRKAKRSQEKLKKKLQYKDLAYLVQQLILKNDV